MKKVDFNKLQAGDLVKVPRTQFAPMRSGWNGWLFSEAVCRCHSRYAQEKRAEAAAGAGKESPPLVFH